MGKIILTINSNYTVNYVKELIEKAIIEMKLKDFIENIEIEEDKGSWIKIGEPLDISKII